MHSFLVVYQYVFYMADIDVYPFGLYNSYVQSETTNENAAIFHRKNLMIMF